MMKTMRYRLLCASMLAGFCLSCTQQEVRTDDVFLVSVEQPSDPETRVYADENLMVLWHADDRVTVFNRSTYNEEYRFTGETGDNAGTLAKVDNGTQMTGKPRDYVYAVYPYVSSTRSPDPGALTFTFPLEQTYAPNTMGRGANAMVSVTDGKNLCFKNVCGYLVLKLYGADVTVYSIKLRGNALEPISGKSTITADLDGAPSVEMMSTANSEEVLLVCPEPVTLGATANDYTEFWFAIPPTSFATGFSITVTSPEGGTFTKSTSNPVNIERNELNRMAATEVILSNDVPQSTVREVQEASDRMIVRTEGLVTAVSSRGFILSDQDSHILVYTGVGKMTYSLGDQLDVVGTKATYQGVCEIAAPALSIRVLSTGNALPELDYRDITGEFSTFTSSVSAPIRMYGTLSKSSSSYYVSVEGADRTGNLFWPQAVSVDESLLGKNVVVSGFYEGLHWSSGTELLDIVMTSMEEFSHPNNEIWYTTTDGNVVDFCDVDVFEADLVSNTYEDGRGIWRFDAPLTRIGQSKNGYSVKEDSPFCQMSTLETVSLPESIEELYTFTFFHCENLRNIQFPSHLRRSASEVVSHCGINTVTIPQIDEIVDAFLYDCQDLSAIDGPGSTADRRCLISEGRMLAFAPKGLTSFSIPEGVVRIGSFVFFGCSGLTDIVFPDGLCHINSYAFMNCRGLTELVIPASMISIGIQAFSSCKRLERITILAETPPFCGNSFEDTNNCPIYVPAQSVDAYKSSGYWSAYADRIFPIESGMPVPEAVDLGLPSGLKWASFNLGASKPEEYGDYYAWGETEPHYVSLDPLIWKTGLDRYYWTTYKWCMGTEETLTKYCHDASYGYEGFTDDKVVLDPEDDAAAVHLHGGWHMPTKADRDELRYHCTWEWTSVNGVSGYLATGPNGNSIFLPAAGSWSSGNSDEGISGGYWTSSFSQGDRYANVFSFDASTDFVSIYDSHLVRYMGSSIRPVTF